MIRIRLPSSKPSGGLIRCRDCGKTGHIEVYTPSDVALPEGWQMTSRLLRHHYFCPNCATMRIERVKRTLSIHR